MSEMGEAGLAMAIACMTIARLGIKAGLDDDTMNAAAAEATQTVLAAEAGDPEALALVADRTERILSIARQIVASRAGATRH